MEHESGQVVQSPDQAAVLAQEGWVKCRNPVCNYWASPQEYEDMEANRYTFSCPRCKLTYPLLDPAPFRRQGSGFTAHQDPYGYDLYEPLGIANRNYETKVGLTMEELGQLGEDVVENLGEIPGYGRITWVSPTYKDPLDFGIGDWGVEVKTLAIDVANHRFIPGSPTHKLEMIARAQELGYKAILGILVILDFKRSMADLYAMEMPLDPWVTQGGRQVQGPVAFRKHNGQKLVAEVPFDNPFLNPQNPEPQQYDTEDDIPW